MKNKLNLERGSDIYEYMVEKIKMDRSKIAHFAILAEEIALKGDDVCMRILNNAVDELVLHVLALKNILNFKDERVKVSYSGGMFNSQKLILDPFVKKLEEKNCEIIKPKASAVMGACILARKADKYGI
jgi:N-acetylglucosamine kinase-like BadF-type ATPase